MDNKAKNVLKELQQTLRKADELINLLLEENLTPETKDELTKIKSSSEESIMVTVADYLIKLGIPAHIKGYQYLKTAIIMVDEDDTALNIGITKAVYPAVAKRHGTTPSRVERAIRHAIEVGCDRGDPQEYKRLFGYSNPANCEKATNSYFIAGIVEDMRLRRLTQK